MLHKVWHTPAHRRKYWKKKHTIAKIGYYMKPFAFEIINALLQPLPFPTIFKFVYSVVMLLFLLMPIIYPLVILFWTYIDLQILLRSQFGIQFPSDYDLVSYLLCVIFFKAPCQAHHLFLKMYFDRIKVTGLTIISLIDYMRLVFFVYFENGDI